MQSTKHVYIIDILQGDPWSSYLFILIIEPLALCIRRNINFKIINIDDKVIKVGRYKDDAFLTLDESSRSIPETLKVL